METYLHCADEMIRQALGQAAELGIRVLGIGLGLPGLVDVQAGELKFAPSLHWHEVNFRSRWRDRFNLPLFIENDANAGALGEYYFGVARNTPNFLYIGATTGLGGGIIIDGALFRGRGGFAGEVGHITLNPEGDLCSCGRKGCWETVAGPSAIVRKYLQRSGRSNGINGQAAASGHTPPHTSGFANGHSSHSTTIGDIVKAADLGDLAALSVLQDAGYFLGLGIANLVNIFNPELVVLGGALSLANELLIPIIKETVRQNSLYPMRTSLSIVPSQHAVDDSIMGAIALVLDDLMHTPG
jgi:predicted NBD/HSP70 family sugar kinase